MSSSIFTTGPSDGHEVALSSPPLSTKPYGTVRGLAVVKGDEVRYLNRHGQGRNGIVRNIYVEMPGWVGVKRAEWDREEIIDLSDAEEYPRVSFHPGKPHLYDEESIFGPVESDSIHSGPESIPTICIR